MESEAGYDDVTGQLIDMDEVKKANLEEMEFIKTIPAFEEVAFEEGWQKTGRDPITTNCVDHKNAEGMRSRWVARGFQTKRDIREDLFVGMLLLETKELLFTFATKTRRKVLERAS